MCLLDGLHDGLLGLSYDCWRGRSSRYNFDRLFHRHSSHGVVVSILGPHHAGEPVLSGSALSITAGPELLVVIIVINELLLFLSDMVSNGVSQLREDVSGSAAVEVGLAHSVTEHSSRHLVTVGVGHVAVAMSSAAVRG